MFKLDMKDHAILSILRDDARLPLKDIAKKAKLRPSTVHSRIQRLIAANIIEKFTLKLNNKAVGEDFIAFMFMTTSQDLPSSFFETLCVKEAFGVTGEYDLILKLKFANIEQFNQFVISLRKRKEIVKTMTTISTVVLKEEL